MSCWCKILPLLPSCVKRTRLTTRSAGEGLATQVKRQEVIRWREERELDRQTRRRDGEFIMPCKHFSIDLLSGSGHTWTHEWVVRVLTSDVTVMRGRRRGWRSEE